ncbi:MAG: transposase [Propionibacteriaceae bacterium]|jgi:transposase-like protein|nr:transposase [Propionibacteriaceae bacterium]
MARQNQSALDRLAAELRGGAGADHGGATRRPLEAALQDLTEAEAAAVIGAARHERTRKHTTRRDRHRPKTLAAPAGQPDLAIPKLRASPFFPSRPEPRRRAGQALRAVTCQTWADGLPTRKADTLAKALGDDSGVPKPAAPRICQNTDKAAGPSSAARSATTAPGARVCGPTPPASTSA